MAAMLSPEEEINQHDDCIKHVDSFSVAKKRSSIRDSFSSYSSTDVHEKAHEDNVLITHVDSFRVMKSRSSRRDSISVEERLPYLRTSISRNSKHKRLNRGAVGLSLPPEQVVLGVTVLIFGLLVDDNHLTLTKVYALFFFIVGSNSECFPGHRCPFLLVFVNILFDLLYGKL